MEFVSDRKRAGPMKVLAALALATQAAPCQAAALRKNNPWAPHSPAVVLAACNDLCKLSNEKQVVCTNRCGTIIKNAIPAKDPECHSVWLSLDGLKFTPPQKEALLKDLDYDHDGSLSMEEAQLFGRLSCTPGPIIAQMFDKEDNNPKDGKISQAEWDKAGEDTKTERQIDEFIDETIDAAVDELDGPLKEEADGMIRDMATQEVDAKDFGHLDADGDGYVEEFELFSAVMGEVRVRKPDASHELLQYFSNKFWKSIDEIFPKIDTNGDFLISQEEYEAASKRNDMGDELEEATEETHEDQEDEAEANAKVVADAEAKREAMEAAQLAAKRAAKEAKEVADKAAGEAKKAQKEADAEAKEAKKAQKAAQKKMDAHAKAAKKAEKMAKKAAKKADDGAADKDKEEHKEEESDKEEAADEDKEAAADEEEGKDGSEETEEESLIQLRHIPRVSRNVLRRH